VIVAVSADAVRAAMTAAAKTPIVASFVDDPVKEGLAKSLSRPGGKVTGVAMRAADGNGDALNARVAHGVESRAIVGLFVRLIDDDFDADARRGAPNVVYFRTIVARLFAGGDPAEMPFEQPTHFVMAIHSKVAGTIGITVPLALLARADEVIE
jgi:ABC-type uncharacterized transport system substrate-binding protein